MDSCRSQPSEEDRLSEIQLYELVAKEIENNQQVKGLWAKALADCKGDEKEARGLYIKLRVQMIKDEWTHKEKLEKERLKKKTESNEARQRHEERQSRKKATKGWGQPPKKKHPKEPAKKKLEYQDWVFYVALGSLISLGVIIVFFVWMDGGN